MTRKIKIYGISLIIALVSIVVAICSFRYLFWEQRRGKLKEFGAHLIALPGHLNGLNKNEVVSRLGEPDAKSDRYALILVMDASMTMGLSPDLLIRLETNNHVAGISYAWRDFVAHRTNRFDWQEWRRASEDERIDMTADLISGWQDGRFRQNLSTLSQIETNLGNVLFVDRWLYNVTDTTSLAIDFNAVGKVRNTGVVDD